MAASAVGVSDSPTRVLTLAAVRWAIDELKSSKVHPFFLAYLQLRKRAAEDGSEVIAPHWDELAEIMRVSGGPPGKPYYRPFWHGNADDPSRYWLNRNIAGSYAPSSLRNVPLNVVNIVGSEFALKPHHTQLARQHLLFDKQLSAIALSAFFYRNYGLSPSSPAEPSRPSDLVAVFREDFHFTVEHDEDFAVLFNTDLPKVEMDWFEPFDDADSESQ